MRTKWSFQNLTGRYASLSSCHLSHNQALSRNQATKQHYKNTFLKPCWRIFRRTLSEVLYFISLLIETA